MSRLDKRKSDDYWKGYLTAAYEASDWEMIEAAFGEMDLFPEQQDRLVEWSNNYVKEQEGE